MKGAFGFSGFLDLAFLFIEDILHDVQKGPGFILISISLQTLTVYPANNDMANLCPNLWQNNPKSTFFLGADFLDFDIYLFSPKNACSLCALYGKVTEFFSFPPKYTVQTPVKNKQVCT